MKNKNGIEIKDYDIFFDGEFYHRYVVSDGS